METTGILLKDKNAFQEGLRFTAELLETINNPYEARKKVSNITIFKSVVLKEAEELLQRYKSNDNGQEILAFFIDNTHRIFSSLKKRIIELRIWGETFLSWEYFAVDEVIDDLKEFLEATAKNSNGKFTFTYSSDHILDNQYYVHFDFKPLENDHILLPAMMVVSIQDLMANARKYSLKNGQILVSVAESENLISVHVKDKGIGIKEDEFDRVIEFAGQGSNITRENSSGGGFGLTKAYYLTRQNKGRFWIDSEVGKGTDILMEIPKP